MSKEDLMNKKEVNYTSGLILTLILMRYHHRDLSPTYLVRQCNIIFVSDAHFPQEAH